MLAECCVTPAVSVIMCPVPTYFFIMALGQYRLVFVESQYFLCDVCALWMEKLK